MEILAGINLAIWLQTGHSEILPEFNFASGQILASQDRQVLIISGTQFGDASLDHQTSKFSSPPIFPLVQYFSICIMFNCFAGLHLIKLVDAAVIASGALQMPP